MTLTKYKIGQLIKLVDERNSYGLKNFSGININKEFIPTVADTEDLDESKYKVVRKNRFVFSGMQTGRDECIRISMYLNDDPIIVSPAYTTFEVVATDIIVPTYFFMIFLSKERDRLGWFYSDGSIRANLDWDRFCEIELNLPDVPTQQKYVRIYIAMVANQQSYERGLEDLKLVCDGYIEDLRRKLPCEKIGKYIKRGEKNFKNDIKKVVGIGMSGFIEPQKTPNRILKNYKILRRGSICYAPPLYNILSDAIHCYNYDTPAVCSPIYEVFSCKPKLEPNYLMMWLKREEFKRYAEFYAGGVRNTFDFSLMQDVEIPIPAIRIQKSISNIYKVYLERKKINEQLKTKIKDICPVLIKDSLEARGNGKNEKL